MINLKPRQLIGGLIAIALVVAISTFYITKFATNDAINMSSEQVSVLSEKINKLQAELDKREVDLDPSLATRPANNDSITIAIDEPMENSSVKQFISVRYVIKGNVPKNHRPVLVIRDPLGQYWSWGTSSSGIFRRVQIGVTTDNGRKFEIGILVTDKIFPMGSPRMSLPKGIAYTSVFVVRK